MSGDDRDHSIEHEPHLRGRPFRADSSEEKTRYEVTPDLSDDDRVDHSVWDEPALRITGMKAPIDALTFEHWLADKQRRTTAVESWAWTGLIVLATGPMAVIGTMIGTGSTGGAAAMTILGVVLIGPLVEEVMKVVFPLWVAERKPYLFRSRLQIAVCALAGGLAFAAIENVLYLNVYVPDPPAGLVTWRWTVCVALHMGCSLIAGLGVMRVWSNAVRNTRRPQATDAYSMTVTAVVIHGTYNAFAVALEFTDFHF
jgi:RsiW-degrading membrane proteinase PrsW (M82 family)